MPTYTGQNFQNKTRFYLHFLTCSWGCCSASKKIAYRNFKKKFANAHLHFVFKTKNEIFVINKLRKYGIFQMQELEKNTLKISKKYCRRQSGETALTELPIVFLVLYQKRLNGH